MNIDEHIKYWLESAEHDLDVSDSLFKSEKYDWSLFVGHLVLEKALKAIFVKTHNNRMPPKIHNLLKLARLSDLDLYDRQELLFAEINEFNIATRYPDYKSNFYKKCTRSFAEKYLKLIKEQYKWLKSQLI
ncbi:MAG: HEPN domain-containing protein [Calditrichaeota bacterium]|nr:HEPN domain-containing protein [Calditrichota bacterium]